MNRRGTSAPALDHGSMSVGTLVEQIERMLVDAGIADAGAEARDLVAVAAGTNRFWPRLHAGSLVAPEVSGAAYAAASKRASGTPFAYAVGQASFRHLTLLVDERVLIPRQETEVLVDLVLGRATGPGGVVADVGTGSGAIALALATEGRFERVIATDIAVGAIAVARKNASMLQSSARTPIEFRTGDLLTPLAGERLDFLVSNPPYIALDEANELPASVRDWEPGQALFSGGQGLDATSRIIAGAPALLSTGGLLALEVDSRRAHLVADLVASSGCFIDIELCQDLTGRDRFVLATRD